MTTKTMIKGTAYHMSLYAANISLVIMMFYKTNFLKPRKRLSTLIAEPKGEPVEPVHTEVKTEIKAENPDADSDFLSDDSGDESTKVKNEGAENVKTDPDIEMQQKSETLEEFKARFVAESFGVSDNQFWLY